VRRRGSFRPLHHDSEGYEADGKLNEVGLRNRDLYLHKWQSGQPREADGLSTLSFEILSREILAEAVNGQGVCEKLMVRLSLPGSPG
jgi:hypothetical protein